MKKEYEKDLNERLFEFSVRTIKYLKTIKNEPEISVIKYQLSKSSTSSGANYEEAQAASSLNDFTNNGNLLFLFNFIFFLSGKTSNPGILILW